MRRLVLPACSCLLQRPRVAGPYHSNLTASPLDERLQLLASAGVPQLSQRLGLDLTNALARDLEVLPNFLEGVIAPLANTKAHTQHFFLARSERRQHLAGLLTQVHGDHRLR